jgi:hypothetical protein
MYNSYLLNDHENDNSEWGLYLDTDASENIIIINKNNTSISTCNNKYIRLNIYKFIYLYITLFGFIYLVKKALYNY